MDFTLLSSYNFFHAEQTKFESVLAWKAAIVAKRNYSTNAQETGNLRRRLTCVFILYAGFTGLFSVICMTEYVLSSGVQEAKSSQLLASCKNVLTPLD